MLKKIVSFLLILVMVCPLLACNMFEHNYKIDYNQIVAVIKPFEEKSEKDKNVVFNFEGKNIYKYQLVEIYNANIQNLVQQQGMTVEAATDYLLEQLIIRELVLIEVDKQIKFGQMTWFDGTNSSIAAEKDYTDENNVKRAVYKNIDASLNSIKTELLKDRGYDAADFSDTVGVSEKTTTYPLEPSREQQAEVETEPEREPFELDKARWPGVYGDEEDKSLGREIMRRFLDNIKKSYSDDLRVTKEDEEAFKTDNETINKIINEQGYEYVYPALYDLHYIYLAYKKAAIQEVKYNKVRKFIEDGVTVSDNEVVEHYNAELSSQATDYSGASGVSAYNAAMTGGQKTVLYHPSSKYFYVKHILLPFSDAQKAELNRYKNSAAQPMEIDIENKKKDLAAGIVAYPHVDGEDDKSNPKSVDQIFTEIKAAMSSAMKKAVDSNGKDSKDAERLFDSFIYKYNTDSGAFNNDLGYIESVKLEAGETETYMPEFAAVARELNTNYKVGQIYEGYAITDYGVHIMYYAKEIKGTAANPVIIDYKDYQTAAQYTKVFDVLKKEIETKKIESAYKRWEDEKISYYMSINKLYETFKNRYKDMYNV